HIEVRKTGAFLSGFNQRTTTKSHSEKRGSASVMDRVVPLAHNHQVWIIADSRTDQRFLEAILKERLAAEQLEVCAAGMSGGSGYAIHSLREPPDRLLGLVQNTNTETSGEIRSLRASLHRLLTDTSPFNWHVALAVPRLDAWAMVDPRVKEVFDADPETR